MIKLIRGDSGGEMWVHESRLDEYLAAGHKLAAPPRPYSPKSGAAPQAEPRTGRTVPSGERGNERRGGTGDGRKHLNRCR